MISYTYTVTEIVKVTDGDTYWLRLDMGFRQSLLVNIRLLGYDCPEKSRGTPFERSKGVEAQTAAADWLNAAINGEVVVSTQPDPDSFGRWLGDVCAVDAEGEFTGSLGESLLGKHLATVWPTRWHEVYDLA